MARAFPFRSTTSTIITIAALIVGGALTAAWVWMQSAANQKWVLDQALAAVGEPDRMEMSYGKLEGQWPWNIVVHDFKIADREGPWLTSETIALDWAPFTLLTGAFKAYKLEITDLALIRLPPPGDDAEEADDGWLPSLPVDIDVDTLNVPDFHMGAAVAGQSIRASLQGPVVIRDDVIRSNLTILRTDKVQGSFVGAIDFDRARRKLKLSADLEEGANGLLNHLIGEQTGHPIQAKLTGDGPADDWRGELRVTAGGYGNATLGSTLIWVRHPALTVTGLFEPGSAIEPRLRELIGNQLTLQASLQGDSGGSFQVDQLEINANNIVISGQIGRKAGFGFRGGRSLDGNLTLAIKDIAPLSRVLSPLTEGTIEANLKISGNESLPDYNATISASNLKIGSVKTESLSGALSATAEIPLFIRGQSKYVIDSEGVADGLTLLEADGLANPLPHIRWSLGGGYDPETEQLALQELSILSDHISINGNLNAALDQETIEGQLNVGVAAAVLADTVYDGILEGQLNGDLDIQMLSFDGTGRMKANVQSDSLQFDDALSPVFGESFELSADIEMKDWSPSFIHEIDGKTGSGITVSGTGGVGNSLVDFDGRLSLTVKDIAILNNVSGLSLSGSGLLTIEPQNETAPGMSHLTGQISEFVVGGVKIGQVDLESSLPLHNPSQSGQIALSIDGDLGPGRFSSGVSLPSRNEFSLSPIEGNWLGIDVNGNVDFSEGFTGTFVTIAPNLDYASVLSTALNGPTLAGSFEGRLVAKDGGLQLLATGNQLRVGSEWRANTLTADGTVGVDDDSGNNLTLLATNVVVPGLLNTIPAKELAATLRGPLSASDWSLKLGSIDYTDDSVSAKGELRIADNDTEIVVTNLSGALDGNTLKLDKPIEARQSSSAFSIDPFTVNLGNGRLSGQAAAKGTRLDAKFAARSLPIWIEIGPKNKLRNLLNADILVQADVEKTIGDLNLNLSSASDGSGTKLSGRWDGRNLSLNGSYETQNGEKGKFVSRLPITYVANDRSIILERSKPLKLSTNIKMEVAPVWRLLPYAEYRLEGQSTVDLEVLGTLDAPVVDGTVTVEGGEFESYETGLLLSNVELLLEAERSRSLTLLFSSSDPSGDSLKGNGRISTTGDWPINLQLDLDRANIIRRDTLNIVASGELALSGDRNRLDIKGPVTLNRIEAYIPDYLPPNTVDLDVEEKNAPPRVQKTQDTETDDSAPVYLAIDVNVPNRAMIEGRGLTSEWSGKLRIRGTTENIRIGGKANIVKGTFLFAGREFDISRGELAFRDGSDIDPILNVVASRQQDGTSLFIRLSGPASNPQISLSSNPALPQEAIMAQVLFGKDVSELTYVELAQLAQSLATISGKSLGGGGPDIVSKVRRSLGVDVLKVDTGDLGTGSAGGGAGPSLTVGKYVSDRVYVGVSQGTGEESTAVEVDVELTPNLNLTTEVGQSANSSVGLDWRWDY